MRYALTRGRRYLAVGAYEDPLPVHLECEQILQHLGTHRWFCAHCRKVGYAVEAPAAQTPRMPSTPELMAERWTSAPRCGPTRDAPAEPALWQRFFDLAFPTGMLVMWAHDDAAHTIPDDSPLMLASGVRVAQVQAGEADLEVWDPVLYRPVCLRRIFGLTVPETGVVVAHSRDSRAFRLDGHLTDREVETCLAAGSAGLIHD